MLGLDGGRACVCMLGKSWHLSAQCWVWVRERLPGRRPVFACAVHLPPRGSDYWSARAADATSFGSAVDAYNALQAEAVLLKGQGEVVMLGDSNARTGCEMTGLCRLTQCWMPWGPQRRLLLPCAPSCPRTNADP